MTDWLSESSQQALTQPSDREFEALKKERTGYWFDSYDENNQPVANEIWKLLEPYGPLEAMND